MRRLAIVVVLGAWAPLAGCLSLLDLPPAVVLDATVTRGEPPLTVGFSARGSYDDEGILTYSWSFGDGRRATGETCEHTYTHPDAYTARLAATDARDKRGAAFLYCAIVRPYVEELYLLSFEGHFASAVPVDWSFIAGRDDPVAYYEHDGIYFAFAETSEDPPRYPRIGELPKGLRHKWEDGEFVFYDVGSGSRNETKGRVHDPPPAGD